MTLIRLVDGCSADSPPGGMQRQIFRPCQGPAAADRAPNNRPLTPCRRQNTMPPTKYGPAAWVRQPWSALIAPGGGSAPDVATGGLQEWCGRFPGEAVATVLDVCGGALRGIRPAEAWRPEPAPIALRPPWGCRHPTHGWPPAPGRRAMLAPPSAWQLARGGRAAEQPGGDALGSGSMDQSQAEKMLIGLLREIQVECVRPICG